MRDFFAVFVEGGIGSDLNYERVEGGTKWRVYGGLGGQVEKE